MEPAMLHQVGVDDRVIEEVVDGVVHVVVHVVVGPGLVRLVEGERVSGGTLLTTECGTPGCMRNRLLSDALTD